MIHHSYNKFVYLNNNVICPITSFSSLPTTEFSFEPSLAKGFITGSRLSVETCDDDRSLLRNLNWYTYSKTGYDYEGRPDCCVSSSALSGFYIQTTTGYTRQGHVTETDSKYLTPYSLTYCVGESFSTDALGNPTSQSARLGLKQSGYAERNLSSLKLDIAYNALGKPSRKSTAGNSVTIDYGYNMRGMLSSISSTAFSQSVFYNDGLSPCYNGNISGITNTYGSGTPVAIQFSYDRLNRLTASLSSDGYNTAYSYSLNSSPLTVLRRGLLSDGTVGTVDDLAMTYSGNRLTKTVDSADPVLLENSMDFTGNESVYSYDADGRMTADSGRGITSISYNRFDRPECIEMENGTCIFYAYDAAGQKIAEMYRNGFTTDTRHYLGQGELTVSNSNTPSFSRVNFDWGYINSRNIPQLYIKDYQGNVRAVVDTLGKAAQTTDYYPYGLPKATATAPSVNRYKYGGKELDTRNGLNQYDFHARIYNPAVPIFTRIDPRAIEYPNVNPYTYCLGNPIMLVDPTGEDPTEMEAILMAIYSYLDGSDMDNIINQLNENGWQISNMADDLTLNDESTDLNSMVFERTQDGQTEYAYVYAGTADNKDIVCDYALVNGVVHPQIIQALDNAQTIDERATDMGAKLTFVGHSLGGFLASTASRKTNRPAMTFNPAGTHPLYDAKLALMPPVNVNNYVIMGASPLFTDPVFTAGAIHGIFPSGKIVPVCVRGVVFFPHGIRNFRESNLNK